MDSTQGDSSSSSHFRPPPNSRNSHQHRRTATSSAYSFNSSVDHSVSSIPEETAEDIASLELQQQHQHLKSPRRHSEPTAPNMAGLAQFGRSAFKQLMVGGGSPQLASPAPTTKKPNDGDDMVSPASCIWQVVS